MMEADYHIALTLKVKGPNKFKSNDEDLQVK